MGRESRISPERQIREVKEHLQAERECTEMERSLLKNGKRLSVDGAGYYQGTAGQIVIN